MNIEQAKEIVISAINTALEGKAEITEGMQLIGAEAKQYSTLQQAQKKRAVHSFNKSII